MNFLQPWMLAALPLAAIPIIIHLVNQRRFQTVPWAAMRFLLEANRMSSGYTRLRQWLILAMRTLAILALILFTARPLTSGIMALISGQSGTQAIVILDRSPSMGDTPADSKTTRLASGIDQLSATLETLGVQRVVQIDEASGKPEEYSSLTQWRRAVPRTTWDATSDIPGALEQAMVYAKNNPTSHSMIWLVSDLRQADWRTRDGRWAAVRDGFQALPQNIRFSILDLSSDRYEDRSVRITSAQCIDDSGTPALSLSFRIDSSPGRSGAGPAGGSVSSLPVEIAVGNSRTSLDVAWTGTGAIVNDYRLPLPPLKESDSKGIRGWGWVKIPGDANPANDTGYFAFEQPPPRRTLIVSDNPDLIGAIELCASIAPQQSIQCQSERVTPAQLASADLSDIALLVWHDRLPSGKSLEIVENFVKTGGQLLMLPPENPDDTVAWGFRWTLWRDVAAPRSDRTSDPDQASDAMARISQWQNDSELLANTLNGAPLPLGQLGVRRVCGLEGPALPLATLPDGQPILSVLENESPQSSAGSVVMCSTTPADRDSTLAGDGVVLYVAIQRMLASGAKRAAGIRQGTAGVDRAMVDATSLWKAGDETAASNQYAMYAGVYESDATLVAIERSAQEDDPATVDESALASMFGQLPWARVGVEGPAGRLIQEIWRWFVVVMLGALILEALLCLPRRRSSAGIAKGLPSVASGHRS